MQTLETAVVQTALDRLVATGAIHIACREEVEAELTHMLVAYKAALALAEPLDKEIWGA